MTKNEKKEWLALYDVAKEILNLKPWKLLWDSNLSSFIEQDTGEEYFFCTMGKGGSFTGISVYKNEQVSSYFYLASHNSSSPLTINYQNCINLFFGSKEEVIPANTEIIAELELSFKKEWISFEKFEKGYNVYRIDQSEVSELTKVLKEYLEITKDFMEQKKKADIQAGTYYVRYFDQEKQEYVHEVRNVPVIAEEYPEFVLTKNFRKKGKMKNFEFELEFLNFLPLSMEDMKEENGNYRFPYLQLIVESKTHFIFYAQLEDRKKYNSKEEYVNHFLEKLAKFFVDTGIPRIIKVRDNETYHYLKDFANIYGISLRVTRDLEALDEIVFNMLEMM